MPIAYIMCGHAPYHVPYPAVTHNESHHVVVLTARGRVLRSTRKLLRFSLSEELGQVVLQHLLLLVRKVGRHVLNPPRLCKDLVVQYDCRIKPATTTVQGERTLATEKAKGITKKVFGRHVRFGRLGLRLRFPPSSLGGGQSYHWGLRTGSQRCTSRSTGSCGG